MKIFVIFLLVVGGEWDSSEKWEFWEGWEVGKTQIFEMEPERPARDGKWKKFKPILTGTSRYQPVRTTWDVASLGRELTLFVTSALTNCVIAKRSLRSAARAQIPLTAQSKRHGP